MEDHVKITLAHLFPSSQLELNKRYLYELIITCELSVSLFLVERQHQYSPYRQFIVRTYHIM